VWEGKLAVSIDALSHAVMVRMQGTINATMEICLMEMVAPHSVTLSQDFNVWEAQLIRKIFVWKYVETEKILIKG
jgi:hypothetical protein